LRGGGGTGARPGRGRYLLGGVAPGAGRGCSSSGCGGEPARQCRAARSLVAVRGGDRRVHRGVGVAATPGIALMRLWERLAHAFGGGADGERAAAERILLEADFGVEATEAILAHVSRASGGDFRAALEHAVTAALAADPAPGDPGALARAPARGADTVLVDTAGRLHTEDRLLDELKKVVRVVAKQQPGAPHESLLVLDGTVGQNAVQQARAFAAAVPLSGLVVTKLD